MTKQLLTGIVLCFIGSSFDAPCCRKIVRKDGAVTYLYYPSCSDSSCYFARSFEKGKLINEIWVKQGGPAGIENFYSGDKTNLLSSSSHWGLETRPYSFSFFKGSNLPESFRQLLNDSTYFNIEFYANGNARAFGLSNTSYCNFGTWIEPDSLNTYKWIGEYKRVNKQFRDSTILESGEEVVTVLLSYFEKTGVWKKVDSTNKVLEEKVYEE